jgi:hypothetical protein
MENYETQQHLHLFLKKDGLRLDGLPWQDLGYASAHLFVQPWL